MIDGPHVQSLVYSMVAREEVILAHHSAFPSVSTSFDAVATACLRNVRAAAATAASGDMLSYQNDAYTFHFLVQDDLIAYLVVSSNEEGDKVALACLQRIQEDFCKRYGDAMVDSDDKFLTGTMNKDFGPRLKDHMQFCLDNHKKLAKEPSMKNQILEVKEVFVENIEKVLVTSGSIHLQVEDTDVHHAQAENFRRQGSQLRKQMRMRQIKLRLLVLVVAIIICVAIWLIICKGVIC